MHLPFLLLSRRLLLAAGLTLLLSASARAQLLAYEGFNYATDSDLTGKSGGTGLSGSWSSSAPYSSQNVIGSSLAYTDINGVSLATTGGAVYLAPTANVSGLGLKRSLANTLGATSGTVYMSFLMDYDNDAESVFDFFSSNGATAVDLGRFYPYLDRIVVTRFQAGAIVAPSSQTTHLYVVKFDLGGGTMANTSKVTVYFDPVLGTNVLTPAATLDNLSTFDLGSFGLTLRLGTPTPAITLDEVRFGTTLSDVLPIAIPEPKGLALTVALGSAALALRRRRTENTSPLHQLQS